MAFSGNVSELPTNLESATAQEIINCPHLKFNLDTANNLVKYRSANNITVQFLSEITETSSKSLSLCHKSL